MGAFSSLEIGKRALQAQQYALDATSNNVANVNTEGYSRRTVNMAETAPNNKSGHLHGTGVIASKLQNYRMEFFDKEVRNTQSSMSGSSMDAQYLKRVETILSEPSENGLNELISNFFNTFSEMASNPEHMGLRTNIISQSKQIAERFNSNAERLLEAKNDALSQANRNISEANTLISDIASLNKEIGSVKLELNGEAQSMADQRALKIEKLSNLFETKVSYDNGNSANVFVNGINLITKDSFSQLETVITNNPVTSEQHLSVKIKGSEKEIEINSGETGSLLKHYNETLDENDSSGKFSVATELNKFANTFAEKINEISKQGFGLNDTGTTPSGYTFFEPSDGTLDMFSIAISDDINGQPENIPLSDKGGEPGNSNLAVQFSSLANDKTAIDNQSFAEYYSTLLSRLGSASKNAQNSEQTSNLIFSQLNSQRDSVMGVNLDEEAVNLVKYQKAFEASSRAITLTNDMLTTLVNIIR
jgi:flagellar hook-associated protein 1 FlgK